MNYEVTIKKACEGFWSCLTPTDWIQITAVLIAMLAAIASFCTVYLTRKQFREESEDRGKKYRPLFKINALNGTNSNDKQYWFDIVNEGFPFYVINRVEWVGDPGVILKSHFKGYTERKKYKGKEVVAEEKYDNYSLIIQVEQSDTGQEGYIKIDGLDMEHNLFQLKTPLIKINQGKIINSIDITHQYLR